MKKVLMLIFLSAFIYSQEYSSREYSNKFNYFVKSNDKDPDILSKLFVTPG